MRYAVPQSSDGVVGAMLFEVVETGEKEPYVPIGLNYIHCGNALSPGIPGKVTQMAGHGCRVMAISLLVFRTEPPFPSEWSVHVVDRM